MLHQGSLTKQLHSSPCILCNAQNAAPVRSHLAPLRRNVRTSFRVSEPSDTQISRDQEETCTAQRLPPPDHLPATPQHHPANPYPLKNAQLGHSRFSRGAPHICYGQVGSSGVFYIKPEVDDLVDDWQQWFAGQQQQLVARPQQQWEQQRRHVEAWMHAQQGRLSGLQCPPGVRTTSRLEMQPVTGNSGLTSADGTQTSSSCGGSSTGGNAAGTTDEAEDRQSLLNSIRGKSAAAGSLGIAVTLAAAIVAALKSSYLRSHGSAQRLLLGAAVGVSAVLLLMQCSKWLVAALFLCYAGIFVL